MPRIELPIDLGFYESDSLPLAAQECVNLYPANPQAKNPLTPGALFRTPGRGFHKFLRNDTLFSVSGGNLYSKTNIATHTLIGPIAGTGRVSMASNALTLCIIVPGGPGYFWDEVSGLVQISDVIFTDFQAQLGGVTSVCLKDNRFIFTTNEEFFLGSNFTTNKGQDFDALDFEDAESSADPIVRAMTIKDELYLLGTESIELYQNVGGASFPYTRIPGATIEKGIKSRFGIIEFDNSFLFLGQGTSERPAIWKGVSGGASKISTSAIDSVIQSYTDAELQLVTTWTYSQDGGFFAGFNFPNETFVYDGTASALQQRPVWHKRTSNGTTWNCEDIVTMFGEVISSSRLDSRLGLLNRANLDEYGVAIERIFAGGYLVSNGDSLSVSSVELKTKSGFGNTKGTTGANPFIKLETSITGASIYNDMGERSLGIDGGYLTRQIWRRMGRVPYSIVFRFTTSDPIAVDFYQLVVEAKK